ncbi:xanthine dehydrogenase family protein molybdopterin-binding subunit [Mesorhizobium sp. VK25A]|uniref:Xanthine dehydrogenase family protein molybdopterin-binding subunit n=2 Tax=Mesorhizobium TaxID=68287 RepID=A0ABU5A939_9HYPH|nr:MULTISPECIES: xanthine dehydrogenase family protein molybdopterin-binding subunit [unclassified Mesorhizobium]MDX8469848.1 xanthine dehydrogenase family protein molybdopterin-binding subunit [Mesorhizobium sp. VK23B]MDX8476187.1 xanthine dehydrogenase family protein molybdopterin-binding subunit [Mesorhizobium sp. VK23A]MDX8501779.1 xanthine dehydrogenase family protein molybdopterin-binding subunit [Mesorhizobium sp. VK4C]MDX8505542.1 xanthine dehydrogenase family protein molybdopterin-bind
MGYIGRNIARREDRRLLVGRGRFIADMQFAGMLHARILRSPVAHARIKSVDLSAALALPGVAAAISSADTRSLRRYGSRHTGWPVGDNAVFLEDKVRFVGDEIAAVAAIDEFTARDAVELIEVDYEELPAVVDPEKAMADGAPIVHDELVRAGIIPSNVMATKTLRAGNIEAAAARADVTVSARFYCNRPVCNPLETHGVIALWDEATGELTVWSASQAVNLVRNGLAEVLDIPASKVRVIAPDIGGGFGVKVGLFAHEIIAALLSMKTGRPVRILLDRSEELSSCTSRCAQIRYSEMMLDRDGKILGWRERVVQDQGAYAYSGLSVLQMGSIIGILPYKIDNVLIDTFCVYTNKNSGGAYRAYGVPQTSFARDSLVHMAAKKLGCSAEDIMRRNIVRNEECPKTMSLGQIIDSTGVDQCLEKVVSEVDRLGWRKDPQPYHGVGFSTVLKHSSARHPRMDYDHDSVRVCLSSDGSISVETSACPQGQGMFTTLAQMVADRLGGSLDSVHVTGGDSSGPRGLGTWGARTITITGNALHRACGEARSKIAKVAAHVLEVDESELEIADSIVSVKGGSNRQLSFAEIVGICERHGKRLPKGMEPGPIDVLSSYDSPTSNPNEDGHANPTMTYSGAAHACYLKVDPETGKVTLLGYIMAEDCGVAINPVIVEGQHQGAVAMALGQVLYEGLEYDEAGQLLNSSLRDYYVPLATDIPDLSMVHDCSVPSTRTLFGQRSAGETGNPPPMAAVANALEEATGIRFTEMPITPDKILLALRARENAGGRS